MVAILNDYIDDAGNNLGIPNKPTNRHSPNGLARVTPKSNRGAASEEFAVWQKANIGTCEYTSFNNILAGSANWTGGTYLLFTDGTVDGYIWFMHDGVGADPAPNGNNFGMINVAGTDTVAKIVSKLHLVLRTLSNTSINMVGDNEIDVTNRIPGVRTDATAGTLTGSVITVDVIEQGIDPDATAWDGTFTDPVDGAQNLVYDDE